MCFACDCCSLVRQKDLVESMIIISQGPKLGRGFEGLKCLVDVLLSGYGKINDCVERSIVILISKTFRKTYK